MACLLQSNHSALSQFSAVLLTAVVPVRSDEVRSRWSSGLLRLSVRAYQLSFETDQDFLALHRLVFWSCPTKL